jgi:hydrogenase maturation protein HypF
MRFQNFPLDIKIKHPGMGFGAQTKNTVCLLHSGNAVFSRQHPDLGVLDDRREFEKDVRYLLKKAKPVLGCDLHPRYYSTEFGRSLKNGLRVVPVQHHHAHIVSCMAENGLKNQKVIGVAFDGTGLGPDRTLWGGEFLVADYRGFKRAGHLMYVPLPGGESAIRHPGRLALLWLYLAFGERFKKLKLKLVEEVSGEWPVIKKIYTGGFNCPPTSSMGRFFDACSSIILGRSSADMEAELPQELERRALSARQKNGPGFPFIIRNAGGLPVIDPLPVFRACVNSLLTKERPEEIAWNLHYTVAKMVSGTCLHLRRKTGLNRVVLSGGVFQNKVLLKTSRELLYEKGFTVLTHGRTYCHDAGISLGQAVIASHA